MSLAGTAEFQVGNLSKIRPGDTVRFQVTVTEQLVDRFAEASGDYNPLHMDREFVRRTGFPRRVAHGMILAGYVSRLVGMELPGPGALWTRQSFRWPAPVFVGDTVEIVLTATHASTGANTVALEVKATNQNGTTVMEGEGAAVLLQTRQERPDPQLSERIALVTGGSGGIGASIAMELARHGAAVALLYRSRQQEAESVCGEVNQAGGHALAVKASVTDPQAVSGAVAQVRETYGRPIDVLINCAGLPVASRAFLDLDWSDLQAQLDVQVRGAFHCCQAVIPGMLEGGSGRIVNIGSVLSDMVPPPQWTAFVMAKAALKALTRSLAVEFGPQGICVNLVSPGIAGSGSSVDLPERLKKVQAMQTPLRRLATPADIARAVAFLCSDKSGFVTGADIPVCGGIYM